MQLIYEKSVEGLKEFFMAKPFYFSTKKPGGNICVQFLLSDGQRSYQKSTGTSDKSAATKIAMEWLVNGNIPARINDRTGAGVKNDINKITFFNSLRTYDFDDGEIDKIIKILQDRHLIISAVRPKTKESMPVKDFLATFWDYEKSPYVKERAAEGKNISKSYCETSNGRIRTYWLPALSEKLIGEITTDDLKAVISSKEVQSLASKTINGIISAIAIPLRWAHSEGYTENICYEGLHRKPQKSKERKVLTMEDAEKLFTVASWGSDDARLANKVAMHTGMRAGEIAALRVRDLTEEGIHVGNSWCRYMGMKSCKNGDERDIPIPISTELRNELMEHARTNPLYDGSDSFIFYGQDPSKPQGTKSWLKFLQRALASIDYPCPREICFHAWRHFFCSRMLDIIPDKRIVMAMSGHKTPAMLDHYGKHLEHEKTLAVARNAIMKVFGDGCDVDSAENRMTV